MKSQESTYTAKQKWQAVLLIDKGLKYVLGDLKTIQDNSKTLPMSFPQILLVFSGIEFLSALLYSKGTYSDKVAKYISEWMPSKYNRNEGNTTLGRFLYDSLRSGLAHYGNVKEDIVVDHDGKAGRHHLKWVLYKGKDRLFIHGNQFASHFEESVERVKKGIRNNSVSLDEFSTNALRLDEKLEKSKRRDPLKKTVQTSSISEWQDEFSYTQSLPDTTEGTTYKGGI